MKTKTFRLSAKICVSSSAGTKFADFMLNWLLFLFGPYDSFTVTTE